MFADRTSCHNFKANQFRLLLSTFAYLLLEGVRRIALTGTEYANARVDTIRLKFIKIAARVRMTARRVVFHFATSCPYQSPLRDILSRLCDTS